MFEGGGDDTEMGACRRVERGIEDIEGFGEGRGVRG